MIKTLKNLFKQDKEKFVVPKSVQAVIPIKTVWEDGIFLVGKNKYAKTFKFEDINYAVASREDKEAMFLEYSELLNALDSGATTKITINNRRLNKADFEQTILIPMAEDGLDKYRKEYNRMLLDKATGANAIVQDKQLCFTAAVCLLGTAVFCGFHIYEHYEQVEEQTEAFEQIAEVVARAPESEPVPNDDAPVSEGEDVLSQYRELYLQNEDMVGWISIAGTTINYPVMQTPNEPNYYLKRNFEKEYSDLGTPYIQENCDIMGSDNLIVYGHHIKGGRMFGALENYKSKSFYEEHKNIQFDTLTEAAEYEIVAVFKTVAYSAEGYRYYDFVDAENEEEFNAYVEKCKELALYNTGVTAKYGDRLITLSTCEYSAQNGRLVVVAKKVV